MKQVGLTRRWIASDAAFNKFSIIFNVLVIATLVFLRMKWRESEFINFINFELSKVTFRAAMGLSAFMMAGMYQTGSTRWIINDALMLGDPAIRIDKELAVIYGFLTLAFYLMNLFGFVRGILLLPVSPLSLLLLVFRFAKFRNVKESQD